MMAYPSPIPYVWFPIAVTLEARDSPAPRNVGPRLGFAITACSAALLLARVVGSGFRRVQAVA